MSQHSISEESHYEHSRRLIASHPPRWNATLEGKLKLDQINEAFAAMLTGKVARGMIVF